jgi:hypothetical protein
MSNWPKFISHKVVQTAPIVSIGESTSPELREAAE